MAMHIKKKTLFLGGFPYLNSSPFDVLTVISLLVCCPKASRMDNNLKKSFFAPNGYNDEVIQFLDSLLLET